MQEFNAIPKQGTFGTVVDLINANFSLAKVAINGVEYSTRRNKGFFVSSTALSTAIPSPKAGDWALVKGSGSSAFPAEIYICQTDGTWADSGETYDGDEIDLADYLTIAAFNTWKGEVEDFLESLETYRALKGNLSLQLQNCFYIVDNNGNVGLELNENGVFDVKAIGANLLAIIQKEIGDTGKLPTYLVDEYNATLHSVQGITGTDVFSFGFMTDLHFCNEDSTYNEATITNLRTGVKNAVSALKKFSCEYPLATVVMNGDYQQHPLPNTKQMGIDVLMDINEWVSGIDAPKFALCGNHEYSYSGGNVDSSTNFGLSRADIYNYLSQKYIRNGIKKAGERVYYQIDDANGVVFVYITTTGACASLYHSIPDSGIEEDLQDAYDAVVAANTNNLQYIIFSHYSVEISTSTTPASASINVNVAATIDYFKSKGCELIAYIGGHCHSDWVKVHNDTVVISCLQSGLWTNNPSQDGTTYSHSLRTATESAFSIFTVDKEHGKIYCFRFGLGVDRAINYNDQSGTIGVVTYPASASSGGGSGSGTTPVS